MDVSDICTISGYRDPQHVNGLMKIKSAVASVALTLSVLSSTAGTSPEGGHTPLGDVYVNSWEKRDGALVIETVEGALTLRPYGFGALHFKLTPSKRIEEKDIYTVTQGSHPAADFEVEEDGADISLVTDRYRFVLHKFTGNYGFYTPDGRLLLEEAGNRRQPIREDSIPPRGLFKIGAGEALYGLGEFRDNVLNLRGKKRDLVQFNTQAAVPVIYSTAGWGMLWNNPSRTLFEDSAKGMSFMSDHGRTLDYYLFAGDSLDSLVSSYRSLTGEAPMVPHWSLGYHQSRNKYASQEEVLSIAERMKQERIQMSSIFIDYFYWQKYGTGSHRFDETVFPDPAAMLATLHDRYDTRAVITVWPTFNRSTANYEELRSKGMLLEGARALDGIIYDVFNPEARKLYLKQIEPLLKIGLDGWFLDGPEPDHVQSFLPTVTFAGPAAAVRNLYPLLHVENFYNNLLKLHPDRRPYILTRCAWAAQQRTGAAVWSGDIPTTFDELAVQVAAGLSFTATGIPYWTTDIGGYQGGDPRSEEYRELFTRWFQYGTFCPVFRSHGRRAPGDTKAPNELWAYGDRVQEICSGFIDLRYTLMPYIYTLTGDVTHKSYTPMRLLAFDFPEDGNVADCKDQFMYGPSLLVCPVLKAGTTERKVYLPQGAEWIDYWTGERYDGGRTLTADAPIDKIPLYVRAGAIMPLYADGSKAHTPDDPVRILVYEGRDGDFELYKDDGVSFDYKGGEFAYIPFSWNDTANELTIDAQKGGYNMGQPQEFEIVLVGDGRSRVSKTIGYKGVKQVVKF